MAKNLDKNKIVENKITFKQLSAPLKIAVIFAYVLLIWFVILLISALAGYVVY
jgi:hypothetical protein